MGVILIELIYRVGLIIMIGLFFSRTKSFQTLISKNKMNLKDKFILGVIFGALSIVGTVTGIPFEGAIINSRVVGVAVGGLLGGPVVGIIAGLIGGGHRFLTDIGGFTAVACGISTLSEGIIAGCLASKFRSSPNKIRFAFACGIMLEIIQMIIVLMIARPFEAAFRLVEVIMFPMTFVNGIGIALFASIIVNIMELADIKSASKAKQALLIADKTIGHLRNGLNHKTAHEVAKLIYETTDFDAVAITDRNEGMAHVGAGADHHFRGSKKFTRLTSRVIESGESEVAYHKHAIGCDDEKCPLKAAIVSPLFDGETIIGALKLYKSDNVISNSDVEMAKGLANLCSTQLKLSNYEYHQRLCLNAEINMLQAQINPHFLFNTLNVVVSLIRTNPDKAREVLVDLSEYFRKNMRNLEGEITIEEELKHVDTYIKISKARFGEKVQVDFDIDVEGDTKILPLMIQPIVENAIIHGILPKEEGGKVWIIAKKKDNQLYIKIEDDGVGMSQEKLHCIQQCEHKGGIALTNVIKRIRNYYKSSSILLHSEQDKGTKVEICLSVY